MRVAKWGNSLAVRLPKALADALGLKAGDEIEIVSASRRELAIEKVERGERFLEAMKQFQWQAPINYKFDREEANER